MQCNTGIFQPLRVPRTGRARLLPILFLLILFSPVANAQIGTAGAAILHQEIPFIPGAPTFNDQFGNALASCDFDADGHDDLAIGVPRETLIGPISGAGQVTVVYGSDDGLDPSLHHDFWAQSLGNVADEAEAHDHFGSALAAGYFNDDPFCDLAIGIPGEDLIVGADSINDAGAVAVIYGSGTGLTHVGNHLLSQATPHLDGIPETNDDFGSALAAGDWNGDGITDLAIGVPGEDVSSGGSDVSRAGAVNIVYGSAFGLSPNLAPLPDRILTQADLGAAVEAHDHFGAVLAAGDFNPTVIWNADDLVIGVPDEDVGAITDAGAVFVVTGRIVNGLDPLSAEIFTQNTAGLALATAEAGDEFGYALGVADFDGDGADDLAIGSPFEAITFGAVLYDELGLVHVLYGNDFGAGLSTTDNQVLLRPFIDAGFEAGDRFGEALAGGRFNGDQAAELVIGVPRARVSGEAEAGLVFALDGQVNRTFDTAGAITLSQVGSVPALEEAGDRFGETLAIGRFNGDDSYDLAVGVPFENIAGGQADAGAVNVFFSGLIIIWPI